MMANKGDNKLYVLKT